MDFEKQAKLKKLETILGYNFKNINLLKQALTHRSMGAKNNERMEFLGDSLVNFIIADILFHQYKKNSEGDLSRIRAFLVKGETLAIIGKKLNLSNYLMLGPGELKSGGFRRESIIADAVEAIIASVYEDAGHKACYEFVLRIYAKKLQKLDPTSVGKDAKTRLQELLQARQENLPEYTVISASGPAHAQEFVVSCFVAKINRKFEAYATNRRKAEQLSAEQALIVLEKK
jgi:ribonuclease-3